ncbi:NAD(P)H-binding protein [Nocardioides aurantiacus]|uniref:Uncharacterized protein YbjT (DUF2867 family) n=1 Tax=Nocardioides aurantiacus TaxID=86796 RepID=A0A3N2CU61_9ACTN|nr:NAD(P)H-binding protein [Nocardioides aurantiacus]ROR91006.1 uncharacterized protein YbjT (DUF2867 family) [Nocardioides aurantiacus]
MITVTGATGALNGATVEHLLLELDPNDLTVVVRDPDRVRPLADRGVVVRRGDYADPASLHAAFEGSDQLLLVSSNDPGADTVQLHRHAVEAATSVGVGRVLYTSHQGAALASPFAPARVHAETEQLLKDSGLAWTALRNGFYAHSLAWLMGPWQETGVVTVPADGPVSWTSRDDAAQAAAAVVLADGGFDGPVTLTGGEAPTFTQMAVVASELSGRTITCEVVDPEAWVAAQVAAGRPETVARFTLGIYLAAAGGFFAGTDPAMGRLLGRDPVSASEVLAQPSQG